MSVKAKAGRSRFLLSVLCFGFAFLYVPIILMMVYSFNYSRLVPVWGGFSTRWYTTLLESEEVWAAAGLSLKIALLNATFATLLGALAGIALARIHRFRARTLFTGMISAPLVMPEVITGLSLLLLFITLNQQIGWPAQRGITTITIAHITFSMAYVAIIIQSRLAGTAQDWKKRRWIWVQNHSGCYGISRYHSWHRAWQLAGCWRSPCRWTIWLLRALYPALEQPRCRC